uniref:Uncharacterized protein n=1 Tax=Arundo donax TaxID=35708 RepID=A0A0A9CGJ0_ARUDO
MSCKFCFSVMFKLQNVWIIPWTFVRFETSSLSSTGACSPQKIRKLACIYYFKKLVLKLCSQNMYLCGSFRVKEAFH